MPLLLPILLSFLPVVVCTVVEFTLDTASNHTTWLLTPENKSYTIPAKVPGNAHLDLLSCALIAEPNNGFSESLQRWIPSENFTYTGHFQAPEAISTSPYLYLILEGVDTAATLTLNGVALPPVSNMFRTFILPLPSNIISSNATNTLVVSFTGPVPASLKRQAQCEMSAGGACAFANCTCPAPWPGPGPAPLLINAYLRKEQQDFSWDFAPATGTSGLREAPLLLGFSSAALREGAVVSMALNEQTSSWDVNVTVRIASGSSRSGLLAANIQELTGGSGTASVVLTPGNPSNHASVRLTLPASGVGSPSLWWPHGYGLPQLYTLTLNFTSGEGEVSQHTPISVGFRTLELDQSPAPNEGNHFRLRVNGLLIHARGSNWVPHNSLPNRPDALVQLNRHFAAASFANFNIIRVWGGGVYASQAFMDLADAAGIVVFHDAMLGDQFYNTQPSFLEDVGKEIEDNMFRLGHHPSLGVLCGSNEMAAGYSDDHHMPPSSIPFYSALYFDTVLANFSALLPFTPTVSSTPSNGNETATHPWSSSSEIITRGDVHFYNLDGDCLNVSQYPRARWVTEHGWESEPSFFTLAPTLGGPGDYSFNSTMVAARQQHPPGQGQMTFQVDINWGWPHRALVHPSLHQRTARYHRLVGQAQSLVLAYPQGATPSIPLLPYLQQLSDPTDPANPAATAFRDELHMTQVAAGQCLRTAIERWRSFADDFSEPGGGTAGILYWQFAEPWAGPSWSTMEVGGRLKVGHYFAARGFASMLVTGVVLDKQVLAFDASFTTYDPTLLPRIGATGVLELTAYAWAGGGIGNYAPTWPFPPTRAH